MDVAALMLGIEGHRFSSELSLAVGTKAFQRGLREHPLVRRLAEVAKDAETRIAIMKRVEELSLTPIDDRYENRYDVALSAYLIVLSETACMEPEIVAKAASAAVVAPNCWWTVSLSRDLLIHAVATGFSETPSIAPFPIPSSIVRGTPFQEKVPEWFNQRRVTVNDDTQRILDALRTAHMQTQAPHSSNVIAMPMRTEEGLTGPEKTLGRNRSARRKSMRALGPRNPRSGRHAMRA